MYKKIIRQYYNKTPPFCYINLYSPIYKKKCDCIDKCKYTPPSQNIKLYNLLDCITVNNKIKEEIIINYY